MNQRKVSDVCALDRDYVEQDKTVGKASCARGFIFTCCVHLRYVLIHMQTITFGMEEQLRITFKWILNLLPTTQIWGFFVRFEENKLENYLLCNQSCAILSRVLLLTLNE